LTLSNVIYLASLGISVLLLGVAMILNFLAYIRSRINGYLNFFLTLLISFIGFSLVAIGSILKNPIILQISVYVVTPVTIPTYLYFRRAFKQSTRVFLDIFYISLISAKVYDLFFSTIGVIYTQSSLVFSKARGLIGALAFIIEMSFIFSLMAYVILIGITSLKEEKFGNLLILWETSAVFLSAALTLMIFSKFQLTGVYFIAANLYTFTVSVFFYKSPLLLSLLPLKLKGLAVMDIDGNIIDYRVKEGISKSNFFEALKMLLIGAERSILDEPMIFEVNNFDILTFTMFPDKVITLYGWDLDKNAYNYLELLWRESNSKYDEFWLNLQKKML